MAKTNFEKLEVYQKAETLADLIWSVVAGWPSFAKRTVGAQIVRSADSICANIAEGTGRGTPKDKRYFVRIARGSLYETQNWLRRAYRRKLLTEREVESLKPLTESLGPMLNAYLRSIR